MTTGTYRDTLRLPGLQHFLWTQFLGAFNDNVFKIIVSFVAIEQLGAAAGMSLAAAVFISPFLLFSGWSGHVADAYSKRTVLVLTKVLEVVAMGLAVPALISGRLDLQLVVLFLMGAQSTFFSPAKYGIVPEMAPAEDLSRTNGLLEMSTFAAIILGTVASAANSTSGWQDQPTVMGGILVAIAVARHPRQPWHSPDGRSGLRQALHDQPIRRDHPRLRAPETRPHAPDDGHRDLVFLAARRAPAADHHPLGAGGLRSR